MSRVFVHLGMSLDGFIAGPNRGPSSPLGDNGLAIHAWLFQQRAFRRHLGLDGGQSGADNRLVELLFERIGANVMGKRMFEEGEANWPEEAPFHTPVFVLTHEARAPWQRPGGTTFHFVNDDVERALERAREAAGAKDVRICGGRNVVLQYLRAGLVDELHLDIAPVFLGQGLRLFEGLGPRELALQPEPAVVSPLVTHLRYRLRKT